MHSSVLNRAFFRDLFRQTEADEFLIEHPKTGMLMVLVPAGKFLTDTDGSSPFEVELPAFYVAVHPVTNEQYARFIVETDHRLPAPSLSYCPLLWKNGTFPPEKAAHPVVYVSWDDATAYCQWAGMRLPTELEWEKAARGLDGRDYPWGKNWDPSRCRNYRNRGLGPTAGVWRYGSGGAPFGGLQLSGNVWEWCADWYDHAAYALYQQGNLALPSTGKYRVVRGGSWFHGRDLVKRHVGGDPWSSGYQQKVRWQRQHEMQVMQRGIRKFLAGHRYKTEPGDSHNSCGFRCVLVLDASP